MDPGTFTPSEVENLQRLIEENHSDDLLKDDQIKDTDILFFSQFGRLEGTDDATNMMQGSENTNTDAFPNQYPNLSHPDFPQNTAVINFPQLTEATIKKEPFLNFTKYKELDGKSTKVFECGICGKEFGHQYTLMRHLPTHTDERKFQCRTCGKSFRQMSTLSQHRAIHSKERPYICEVCNKTFNRVSTLISHRKTHTGHKPHRCHLCNKAFHQKGNLRNHIFTHTNERPYKCDICERGFNQMSNLMCHKMKTHQHQSDVCIPRHVCKICGQEFLKRINLRQHEQFKHGMETSTDSQNLKDYSNAIVVDPINTEAMKQAMASGVTPFALLRPLSGIPVLVRVLPAGDKQMLVPASAEDLKKYGHISIRPKVGENKENTAPNSGPKTKGCIVQIKVPVVATVIQKSGAGNEPLSIVSPGPGDILDERGGNIADLNTDSFVYTSTFTNDVNCHKDSNGSLESFVFDDKYHNLIGDVADAEIEFLDESNNFQKNMEINSMEFSFSIPHDAQDNYPIREQNRDDIMSYRGPSASMPDISDPSTSPILEIPDKILLEHNGQYVEI